MSFERGIPHPRKSARAEGAVATLSGPLRVAGCKGLGKDHFQTICTRVQFAAEQCPAGSIYGHVTAYSPLLDYSLQGPVYLRSSSHKLPDLVAVVKGPDAHPIEFNAVGRVDSVNGGIRATFETFPDAPISKAVLEMQGGKKGLFVNSRDICRFPAKAKVALQGQNGKQLMLHPSLNPDCG